MHHFYMDTNVFISQLKPDDPFHSEATTIAKSLQKGGIHAETSILTLLEAASVASRLYHHSRGGNEDQSEGRMFVVKTLKMLAGLKIKFIQMTGDASFAFENIQTRMPAIFSESIILSIQTSLRTLDLMHIAAAKHAKQTNHELGAFVTGDTELLLKKERLFRITGMPILSPKEYVEGIGLR